MLYVCATRLDMMKNLKNFTKFLETKQVPRTQDPNTPFSNMETLLIWPVLEACIGQTSDTRLLVYQKIPPDFTEPTF